MKDVNVYENHNGLLYIISIFISTLYNLHKFFELKTRWSITISSINVSYLANYVSSLTPM